MEEAAVVRGANGGTGPPRRFGRPMGYNRFLATAVRASNFVP